MSRLWYIKQLIKEAEDKQLADIALTNTDTQAANTDSYADKFLDALLNNIKIQGLED